MVSANGEDMDGYQSIWLKTYRGERTDRKRPIGARTVARRIIETTELTLGW